MDPRVQRKLDITAFMLKKKMKGLKAERLFADVEKGLSGVNLAEISEEELAGKLHEIITRLTEEYAKEFGVKKRKKKE